MQTSVFDISGQGQQTESKIVVALERISQAFRVLLWEESKEFSLSPIQIQILIFLHFHSEEKRKVGYLAKEFNLTKPTISDSVKLLELKKFVLKTVSGTDGRSYTLQLTPEGEKIVQKTMSFASAIEQPVQHLSAQQKEALLSGLLQVIHQLQQAGIISLQRMCFSCRHYGRQEGGHYCHLMEKPLKDAELRIDCPEHEVAA
jgi:DNA-binding MarR family transcriptional regulator